jgi:hypothetical protein
MPVTIPDPDPIVAILVLLLLQVPPVVALESPDAMPGHRFRLPAMPAGTGRTVAVTTATQPVDTV